jgi:hypothetical protein
VLAVGNGNARLLLRKLACPVEARSQSVSLTLRFKRRLAERGGFEQSPRTPCKAGLYGKSSGDQTAVSLTASQKAVAENPELSEIFHSWPKLPAKARLAILALIRATLNPK